MKRKKRIRKHIAKLAKLISFEDMILYFDVKDNVYGFYHKKLYKGKFALTFKGNDHDDKRQ